MHCLRNKHKIKLKVHDYTLLNQSGGKWGVWGWVEDGVPDNGEEATVQVHVLVASRIGMASTLPLSHNPLALLWTVVSSQLMQ